MKRRFNKTQECAKLPFAVNVNKIVLGDVEEHFTLVGVDYPRHTMGKFQSVQAFIVF